MKTYPRVAFSLVAMTIKEGSTFTCSDKQVFSDLNDLKTGGVSPLPYATYESDFWLLDGNYKFKPEDNIGVHVGLMSLSQSDGAGSFSVPPVLVVNFDTSYTSDGLVLRFAPVSNDYVTSLKVEYFDAIGALISSTVYSPSAWEFSTGLTVSSFKRIEITFYSTNKAGRYLRLTGIDFGTLTYFESDSIIQAMTVQEVNPISVELPIDTLEMVVRSSDAALNIINPTGIYANMKYRQQLDVYEIVGGAEVYIGQFYLDFQESLSTSRIRFTGVDLLGLMDGDTYAGGLFGMTAPGYVLASTLIDSILSELGIPYEIDSSLESAHIAGWIPVCTYREALQQIAFAIGATVTASRSRVLRIVPSTIAGALTTQDMTLTSAEKSLDSTLKLSPVVTGVQVVSHQYTDSGEADVEIFRGYLTVGTHRVLYDEPMMYNYIDSGSATIVDPIVTYKEATANYATVSVSVAGVIVIRGLAYSHITNELTQNNPDLTNVKSNVMRIENVTLVNKDNGLTVLQRMYDYYLQRYTQRTRVFGLSVAPNTSALVETADGSLSTVVEKVESDLTGGFISKLELTGEVIE